MVRASREKTLGDEDLSLDPARGGALGGGKLGWLGALGAGGEIGKDLPAAATRTSPVTQTGVWSLEAE